MAHKRGADGTDSRAARYRRRIDRTLAWDDVDDATALSASVQDMASGLSVLSSSLLRDGVFSCLLPSPERPTDFVNGFPFANVREIVGTLRLVCRHWYRLTQVLVNEANQCVSSTALARASNRKLLTTLRRIEARGQDVKQLQLFMNPLDGVADVWSDQLLWDRVFGRLSNLVRLEVAILPEEIVPLVVAAASRACPHIKDLALETRAMWHVTDPHDEERAAMLFEAMARWYASNGGLCGLTIPKWVAQQRTAVRFLVAVADYCPQIQYLRGRENPTVWWDAIQYCGLPVSISEWTEFRRRCPHIKTYTDFRGRFSA